MPELFGWLGPEPEKYPFYDGAVTLYFDDKAHSYYRYDGDETIYVPGVTTVVGIVDRSAALMQWASNQCAEYMGEWYRENTDCDFEAFQAALDKARMAHKDYKEDAANVGKIAHGWLERHIISLMDTGHPTGESMPEDSRAANGVHAALNWMDAHKVRWVFTERKVYSLRHDYAGTGDGLAYISSCGNPECCGKWVKTYGRWERVALKFTDALALIDWKTSNQLHASYDWQTAGYDKAVEEEIGIHGKFPMLQQLVEYRVIIKLGKDDGEFDARLLTMDTLERDFTTFLQCLDLYRSTDSVEQEDKQRKRELRQQEREDREAANLIACPKSGEFKGFRYPKCNGGEPCATCLAKYNERQAAKAAA